MNQDQGDRYAIYNGDCIEFIQDMPDESVHFSVYSPPFSDLYNYSSSERDLSNCKDYEEFMTHYEFLVRNIARVLKSGRLTAVHCSDIPRPGPSIQDFPGDIIRLHEKHGFMFHARYAIWKEPLRVAIRTRAQGLMHRQIVKDSTLCGNAGADYVLVFRKRGTAKDPVANPYGVSTDGLPPTLTTYAGQRELPEGMEKYLGWKDPKTNKLSHWIWQQYASCMWDDIRIGHVLPYRQARDPEDEKHVCPLQLDVIERCITLWTNPDDIVFTPFMGVGSEVYSAIINGRRAIGVELKPSYFNQAQKNIRHAAKYGRSMDQMGLFDSNDDADPIDDDMKGQIDVETEF